jgi:hypothetical protein
MSVAEVFADFEGIDFVQPRAFYASHTFNMEGTCLYYYINGSDSKGYDAALKIDFFNNRVRFTNFSKPHPTGKYKPYFNKFIHSLSCSYDDWGQELISLPAISTEYLNSMAKHWKISPSQFINTLMIAGELLWDAENEGWLDFSWWEGGEFKATLPQPKHR